ncbi:MAG: hypothetical protein A3H50_02975 [Candidatus Levybacteria bacterium RIFCSPLOWO2_02_FULL_37_10]|nr:MAG: hypothetical protein A3F30_02015 [Candidatus Levybacteria bacterium RIFCSPHIGHO2_12_FULL_37_12]OGH43778.1 MAG: hypothetical protein A3H50_02975 [Candidatus Levybacteria bacterium RIFCSPLOWO2_02_FULL_37_10]
MSDLTNREKFLKVYANLPIPVRDEVVFIDKDKKPMSWNVCYIEVINNTELGDTILKYLESLGII